MKITQAKERCILLNIMAKFYLNPVTEADLQMLHDNPLSVEDPEIGAIWGEFSTLVSNLVVNKQPNEYMVALSNDHLSLFVGLGMPLAPPWGSVYLHDENLLMQETTFEVENFIEKHRLKFQSDERQPVDHIGFCLQILVVLLLRYMESKDATQDRPIRLFLEQHLLTWSNRFLSLVQEHATTSFYHLVSRLTYSVLKDLTMDLSVNKPWTKLHY